MPSAEVTTPVSVVVPASFELSGTFKDVPTSEELWLVTRDHASNRWHPIGTPCAKLIDDKFTCGTIYLGTSTSAGVSFDIVIVGADAQASNEFLRYNNANANYPTYPGLQSLPSGVQILELETVVRE